MHTSLKSSACRPMMIMLLIAAAVLYQAPPLCAADMEITPFRTANRAPLAQLFGIPSETSADVLPRFRCAVALTQDVASNYTTHATSREQLLFDGESYRWGVTARCGVTDTIEAGVEVPLLLHGGGFLDGFIVGWHNFFGLPQGGRDTAPRNQLQYSYRRDGVQKLTMDRSGGGIGDISLLAALKLYDVKEADDHSSLALRGQLKLPTGDAGRLQGSGSTDISLNLCGSINRQSEWGSLGVFGSLGGMAMTRGSVLADQQNNLAGIATAGIGWGPASWISFKLQLNGTTPLYHDSSLAELSSNSLMLVIGGALKLPGDYLVDIGVSEDVAVATAPDVTFHLGVIRHF